jgi:uncharacterized protein
VASTVRLIMVARLPQTPNSLFEEIIADADLDSLGRADFQVRNEALRREMEDYDIRYPDDVWYYDRYKFLLNHTYFTETAR